MPKKQDHWLIELVKTVVYAGAFVLLFHSLLYKPFNIPTPSMVPTLLVGDYLFVSKFTYGYSRYSFPFGFPLFEGRVLSGAPKQGDVIVFRPSHEIGEDWIKRVIGVPGDVIQVVDGIVIVNGQEARLQFKEDYKWRDEKGRYHTSQLYTETLPNGVEHLIVKTVDFGMNVLDNTQEFVVPEGFYFVMGDNRDHSDDSRGTRLGMVPYENIVGQAELIFFSTKIPTDPETYWWQPWKWPTETRYGRMMQMIY
ncbi:MAG: signal peptidase I [Pseudomonadota bacterium]